MKTLALVLLIALTTPALAGDDFPFSPFGNELETGVLDGAPEIKPSPDYDGTVELMSGDTIAIDRTPLNVVSTLFDVAPQTYQHLGYTTHWICFSTAGRRVWYLADTTYETRDGIYVGQIIDEPADPLTDGLFLCKAEPRAMLKAQPELPSIGTTLAELNAFYKTALPERTRYVSGYAEITKAGDAGQSYTTTVLYYRLAHGVVDAIAIGGGYFEDGEP